MPTFNDQFLLIEPAYDPVGNYATQNFVVDDVDGDGNIQIGVDTINGQGINTIYSGDVVTLTIGGVTQSVTGSTFYLDDGTRVFTPTDGTILSGTIYFGGITDVGPSDPDDQVPVDGSGGFQPCYTAGTMIETTAGPVPVEDLRPGQMVLTRDAGPQPVVLLATSRVSAQANDAPVRFETGILGNDAPLLVSAQHRMLLQGPGAELLFGNAEVFAHAHHLVDGDQVTRAPQPEIIYYHLLLPKHHVIKANGCWSESFYPGDTILDAQPRLRAQVMAEIGSVEEYGPTARMTLIRSEVECYLRMVGLPGAAKKLAA